MAKSLRSKWKRKMRAAKREIYGAKELAKLKTMVAKTKRTERKERKNAKKEEVNTSVDTTKTTIPVEPQIDACMDDATMDIEETARKFDKGLRDQFGNYPVWLNPRYIKKRKRLQKGNSKKNKR